MQYLETNGNSYYVVICFGARASQIQPSLPNFHELGASWRTSAKESKRLEYDPEVIYYAFNTHMVKELPERGSLHLGSKSVR